MLKLEDGRQEQDRPVKKGEGCKRRSRKLLDKETKHRGFLIYLVFLCRYMGSYIKNMHFCFDLSQLMFLFYDFLSPTTFALANVLKLSHTWSRSIPGRSNFDTMILHTRSLQIFFNLENESYSTGQNDCS